MTLYQYVSADVGMSILTGRSVGLRKQEHFNDPMEGALSSVQPGANAEAILQQMQEHAGADGLSEHVVNAVKMSQTLMSAMSVGMNCVTLCLTTDPVNPLMWAHYSGLGGMVLGYDVESDFFTGGNNACPIQYGDVIYSSDRPSPIKEKEKVDPADAWFRQPFDQSNIDRVQGAFLFKSERWSYEKEVRLVKRLNDQSEDEIREKTVCSRGRELYLYRLPKASIVEVYRYAHPMVFHGHKVSPGVGGGKPLTDFRDYVVGDLGINLYGVTASLETWDFEFEDLT